MSKYNARSLLVIGVALMLTGAAMVWSFLAFVYVIVAAICGLAVGVAFVHDWVQSAKEDLDAERERQRREKALL